MGGLGLTVKDVHEASRRIGPHLRSTPVFETKFGMLKLENLQHTGAYKVRGACNALMKRLETRGFKLVVTASAGNHAAGVAYAAKMMGLEAWAVVPINTPAVKIANCRQLGCRVIQAGSNLQASMEIARNMAKSNNGYFLHPFDDPDVICGQGTMGLELVSFKPDVVFVPIGGGGLASGVSLALSRTKIKVVGVQIEGADVMNRKIRGLPMLSTVDAGLADGVNVSKVGSLTQEYCSRYLDDIIVVGHDEVVETMKKMALEYRLVVEAAGAIAATVLPRISADRPLAIVSGGNVDLSIIADAKSEVVHQGAA